MYEIKVNKIDNPENRVIAMASITIDEKFVLNSIKVIKSDNPNNERGFFVGMPSFKSSKTDENGKDQYVEFFHPTKKEISDLIYSAVAKSLATGESVKFREGQKESFSTYVRPVSYENSATKGFVTISIKPEGAVAKEGEEKVTDFLIDSVRVNESSKDGKLFVAAPSVKNKDGEYKELCYPITKEFREELYGDILNKYDISLGKEADKSNEASKTFEKGVSENINDIAKGGELNEGVINSNKSR